MIPKPIAVAIVCLITLVWLGNFAAVFLVAGYESDGWVHAIFFGTVGAALGLSRKGETADGSPGGKSVSSILRSLADATAPTAPQDPTPPAPDPPRAEFRRLFWRPA